jgi:hypothetical protein
VAVAQVPPPPSGFVEKLAYTEEREVFYRYDAGVDLTLTEQRLYSHKEEKERVEIYLMPDGTTHKYHFPDTTGGVPWNGYQAAVTDGTYFRIYDWNGKIMHEEALADFDSTALIPVSTLFEPFPVVDSLVIAEMEDRGYSYSITGGTYRFEKAEEVLIIDPVAQVVTRALLDGQGEMEHMVMTTFYTTGGGQVVVSDVRFIDMEVSTRGYDLERNTKMRRYNIVAESNVRPIATREWKNDDDHLGEIEIYPTPARDKLIIEGQVASLPYVIFNEQGFAVMSGILAPERRELDIALLAPGIYWIRIEHSVQPTVTKFIKI